MEKCSRCNNESEKLHFVFSVEGHTLPSLTQPDFSKAIPSQSEHVCGSCITDSEILQEIGPIAEFALSVLIQNAASYSLPAHIVSLETARTFFMVRNIDNDSGRNKALRAIGL
jgi:hypothetical protein